MLAMRKSSLNIAIAYIIEGHDHEFILRTPNQPTRVKVSHHTSVIECPQEMMLRETRYLIQSFLITMDLILNHPDPLPI
jgi:hypothetical protein